MEGTICYLLHIVLGDRSHTNQAFMGVSMAKNRHRNRQRDVLNRIANDRPASFLDDLDQLSLLANYPSDVRSPLQEVEDRREYHPMGDDAPVRSPRRWAVSSVVPNATSGRTSGGVRPYLFSPPVQIGFKAPAGVLVCQRRGTRREVLFAFRRHGKGSRARFRRRSQFSNTRC